MINQVDLQQLLPIDDYPKDECGVVGVYTSSGQASRFAFTGLFALQHRGQECAGIVSSDGHSLKFHGAMGLVTQAFREPELQALPGKMAIGHTRYSTTGSSTPRNIQPFLVHGIHGELALGHNGNIINSVELQGKLRADWGCSFRSSSDSEVMAYVLANAPGQDWEERISHCMRTLQGAYSAVVLSKDALIGFRDPLGIRPLCLGELDHGWVIASESCALDHLGAKLVRELSPGEAVIISDNGLRSYLWPAGDGKRALCIFEHIYLARPDSVMDNKLVYSARKAMGAQLAKAHPVDADVVIGVPDSASAAAVGYSVESGIAYSDGLVKNRFVGRTFMQPNQTMRDEGVRLKFNPLPDVIKGKRVVLVDDSIVRGTTTVHVVGLIRRAGATEVHMRVCAPPIRWPCYMGVDMSTREELIAAHRSVQEIRQFIGVDTLGYLSVSQLLNAVENSGGGYCDACFTGRYPVPVQLGLMDKLMLENSEQHV